MKRTLQGLMIFLSLVLTGAASSPASEKNVILITFDGLRPKEFFDHDLLPRFWDEIVPTGVLYGKEGIVSNYRIASRIAISEPSYQAIYVGHATACKNNGCPRVTDETFTERAVRELGIPREKVAVIASWDGLAAASEHMPGSIFVNAGLVPLEDGSGDPDLADLNQRQALDPPKWGARKDLYTFAQGMRYLDKYRPRYLAMHFDDTDEWGHLKEFDNYREATHQYDAMLTQLFAKLDSMDDYGRQTYVFISTDHSRGWGPFWYTHGWTQFSEKGVYLFVRPPRAAGIAGRHVKKEKRDHSWLRPTIETLLGLSVSGDAAERILPEIF